MGIALSLLFLMWFLSGIGMIYARGMPSLTPAVRLERMPALDFSRVRITPVQAVSRAGMRRAGGRLSLADGDGAPGVSRVGRSRGTNATIFADTGDELARLATRKASTSPAGSPTSRGRRCIRWRCSNRPISGPSASVVYCRSTSLPSTMPRTELYVSEVTAEVVLMTTRSGRAWRGWRRFRTGCSSGRFG
jgi:hypothetical protein